MTDMTTTELWQALEAVLRDKGATDAWIEYALPDLQVAATQYAAQAYGNGHADARCGRPLPNPGDSSSMCIITDEDDLRWLELLPEKSLDEHIAEAAAAQAPPLSADSLEAREKLAEAFRSVGAAECGDE